MFGWFEGFGVEEQQLPRGAGESPEFAGVGELEVDEIAGEGNFAAERQLGGIDFVDGPVAQAEGVDGFAGGVGEDGLGLTVDADVFGDDEGREIDGGDGLAFLVGDEGIAFETFGPFFAAGREGEGGGEQCAARDQDCSVINGGCPGHYSCWRRSRSLLR